MNKESKFVEYWVPVGLSGVQLEQYCANLFCNYSSLCSPSKIDHVGSLQCVLENARKCCDHPYLVDSSLQKLPDETGFLEVGINVSGKLKLLDLMLASMKNKGLRVLVLFQSDCGPCNAGDIVDDVIRFRFGSDCYERYQVAGQPSKRQAALNKFNTKGGSFIFLLEVQSCSSKIKLSNIDCVILYGSDWNPMNDMKSLQKILVDSKTEKINVFRLFSPFTVEEKALLLSRENSSLDSKLKNLSVSANHLLLMWGPSVLYDKLADFHASKISEETLFGQFQPENVFQELSAILDQNGKDILLKNSSAMVKVEKFDYYVTESKLPGENQDMVRDNELPHIFWKRLLNVKQPRWRNKFSFICEKKRKRVQLLSLEPLANTEFNTEEDDIPTAKRSLETNEEQDKLPSPSIANNSDKVPENKNLDELQKNLHHRLKPEIFNLCEVLKLPENIKDMVDNFLDYVMINHRMAVESTTIVEAFQISLCWTVAFFMNFNLNHKSSLSLAKQHLNYSCRKADAEDIFLNLKCLKRVFLSHMQDSPAGRSGLHPDLNQKDLSDSIRDIDQKFSKKLSKLFKRKLNERNCILSNCDNDKQKLSMKKESEELIIKVTTKSLMNTTLNESMEEAYQRTFWELEEEAMNRLKQMEKLHLAAVDRLLSRKRDLIEGLKKWTQVELVGVGTLRDLDSVLKRQSDAAIINPKEEIVTCEIDEALAPLTAENGRQKGLNSSCEMGEEQRLPDGCTGHAQNDLDVDSTRRTELSSEHITNCNDPIVGSSQAINADLSQEITINEGVSSFSRPCVVESNVEPNLASNTTSSSPNLSSSQRNLAISRESTSAGVTNEGIVSLPASVVEPVKEPTSNDSQLKLNSLRGVPVVLQAEPRVIETSIAPTSANRIKDRTLNVRYSQGIDATSPESIRAEDANKSVPSSGVAKQREKSASNINGSFYLRSSQARDANSTEITGIGFANANVKPIEEQPSTGVISNSLPNIMPSQGNGATLPELTPVGVPIEELPNCVLAMSEKDADLETSNMDDEGCPLHVSIQVNSPKDIPVDNETNDIAANGCPSGINVNLECPLGESIINPQVHSLDEFFDRPLLPRIQVTEEHLSTPPSAPLELPARLGISTNDSQNHLWEFQFGRHKQYISPLLIDLDNIVKEKERIIRNNEETKMRLKAECEDELSKIREKYESMILEADLLTVAKSDELNIHYEKVKLSMLVADAFRAKTYRPRPKSVPRTDSVQPWPPGVRPSLPRGYASRAPQTNGNAMNSNLMNDVHVPQSVDVGDVVCVSDDD